jgi:hypothetical protein
MKSINWLVASASACAIVLTACGGGGGSAGNSPFNPNSGASTAADLDITATPSAQISNTSNGKVTVTVTALDSGRRVVEKAPVRITLQPGSDAVVEQTSSNSETNAAGQVTADIKVGSNKANRDVIVVATSGTVSKTLALRVTGTSVTSTLTPPVLTPSAAGKVVYRVVDQSGASMGRQKVQISASGLNPATATGETNDSGEFTFSYTAPSTPGTYTISSSIAGVADTRTVSVQSGPSEPLAVSVPITTATISANPSVVSVNTPGSEANRSEIRVKFATNGNAPIENVRVVFDRKGDRNNIGGRITTEGLSTPLLSDVNGVVTAAYIPGTRSSPTDGVDIRACYGRTNADALACAFETVVTLTVAQQALSVSVGTDEFVIAEDLRYKQRFLVTVVDSAGAAKPDINLSVTKDLPRFKKGFWSVAGDGWVKTTSEDACPNEDTDRSGLITAAKDLDGDGVLEPRASDVSVQLMQSVTRSDGTAVIEISYARSFGSWIEANITVSASGISGSEGRATYIIPNLRVPAEVLKNKDVTPAFASSPYGELADCKIKN